MAKEFFWPASVTWTVPGRVDGVSGGIIYPTRLGYHTLIRRNPDKTHPHLKRRFLDPQLYLIGLDPYTCRTKCAYLVTYPWFPRKPFTPFDSNKLRQNDWQRMVKKDVHNLWVGQLPKKKKAIEQTLRICLQIQENLNCESYILPSPLTVDQATDYSTELQWLDTGLEVSKKINEAKQTLATIAISDNTLRLINPWENELIDLIIDQVSSREPDGAYIVLEQSHEQGYYCTHHNTIGCLLRLVHGLKTGGLKQIVVAYAGTAGFLSLLVGADIWSTGWYKSERKLKLSDVEDVSGIRLAYPAYYSHNFASEFHLNSDLDKIYQDGFRPQDDEITTASKPLIEALLSGHKVSAVPEWKHERSNVAAAREHFVSMAISRTAEISDFSSDELFSYGLNWLKNAKFLAEEISKSEGLHERTAVNHQSSWYNVFKEFVKMVG